MTALSWRYLAIGGSEWLSSDEGVSAKLSSPHGDEAAGSKFGPIKVVDAKTTHEEKP